MFLWNCSKVPITLDSFDRKNKEKKVRFCGLAPIVLTRKVEDKNSAAKVGLKSGK